LKNRSLKLNQSNSYCALTSLGPHRNGGAG
jgi:hypothetical protein